MAARRPSTIGRWPRRRPTATCSSTRQAMPVTERSLVGPLAAGVPGTVAGLALAQRKYGRCRLRTVMAPAIALARDGFDVSWHAGRSLASAQALLAAVPVDRRTFLRPDGTPSVAGERLVQPDLAPRSSAIARQGRDAFYKGPDRRPDRRRDVAQRRAHHAADLARVRGDRTRAAHAARTAATHHLHAAAELGRRGAPAAAEPARGLSARRATGHNSSRRCT